MIRLRTILGAMSIILSVSSVAMASPTLTEQQKAYLMENQNKVVAAIRDASSESPNWMNLVSMNNSEMIFNVKFYAAPGQCYKVKVGEITIGERSKLIMKDLVRDPSCDKN
ncbi:hypothetical protein [Bdellovibrio sp. NC01]|uniref:hypothetical protein n=1 Tax=Bdellovibrio sp. NC01 TaxID=2220073 RepID=UPI0011585466|nr:hypothetical protein [Bdellovibrio sp. NC01]QDK37489.1 hypothetical protein DOE51_07790 [Bdellovibrio sp. NC01]